MESFQRSTLEESKFHDIVTASVTKLECELIRSEKGSFNYVRGSKFNFVTFLGDTAHTQCCGRTAFDRRVATCPCQNDVVYVGIPDVDGACCYRNGEANAYNRRTEACCGIERYNRMDEFCCGSDVGSKDTEVCAI